MEFFKKKGHLALLILLSLIFIIAVYYIEKSFSFRINELENYVSSFGPWVPLVLLIMIIVTSSIGFVFMIPVVVAALLLNAYVAFFISVLGLTIGALISFFVARYFGRDYFERKFREKILRLNIYEERLTHEDFLRIFFLRLIPFVPYELINLGSGLSRIGFIPFILGTFLGVVPGTILTIYFIKSTQNIFSMQFLFASILLAGFSLLPLLSKKVRKIILKLG